jgi:hypothetical protein
MIAALRQSFPEFCLRQNSMLSGALPLRDNHFQSVAALRQSFPEFCLRQNSMLKPQRGLSPLRGSERCRIQARSFALRAKLHSQHRAAVLRPLRRIQARSFAFGKTPFSTPRSGVETSIGKATKITHNEGYENFVRLSLAGCGGGGVGGTGYRDSFLDA